MADENVANTSAPEGETDASSSTSSTTTTTTTSNALTAKVIDTYPQAEQLIQGGVAAFSRAFLDVLSQQVTSSSAELKAFDRVNGVVAAQYTELKDNVGELQTFYKQYNDQVAALKPHLDSIDQLDTVIVKLEDAARVLDLQTKQLEAALVEVLS